MCLSNKPFLPATSTWLPPPFLHRITSYEPVEKVIITGDFTREERFGRLNKWVNVTNGQVASRAVTEGRLPPLLSRLDHRGLLEAIVIGLMKVT